MGSTRPEGRTPSVDGPPHDHGRGTGAGGGRPLRGVHPTGRSLGHQAGSLRILPAMLASDLSGPGRIGLQEIPTPDPTPGEVLVRLSRIGICGSDLSSVAMGALTIGLPVRPGASGHECVGRVVASRAGTEWVGRRVLALPPWDNGFAEYLALPAAACLPLPDEVDDDLAVVAQQLGTVVHALRPIPSILDRRVVIVGQGPAGLAFLLMALGAGARQVITVERRPARRRASLSLGADASLPPSPEVAPAVSDLTAGGADVVIDAAGGQEAIDLAPQLARPGGAILQFGLPAGASSFHHEVAFRRQLTTYRAVYAQEEPALACFRLALRLVARDSRWRSLVSHHLPLAELPRAIALAGDEDGEALKVLLEA
jgi:L-iditol 2-dehydrogenase